MQFCCMEGSTDHKQHGRTVGVEHIAKGLHGWSEGTLLAF